MCWVFFLLPQTNTHWKEVVISLISISLTRTASTRVPFHRGRCAFALGTHRRACHTSYKHRVCLRLRPLLSVFPACSLHVPGMHRRRRHFWFAPRAWLRARQRSHLLPPPCPACALVRVLLPLLCSGIKNPVRTMCCCSAFLSFFLVQFALLAKRRIWEHWDICLAQTQQNTSLYRAEPTCILFLGDTLGDSSSLRGLPLVSWSNAVGTRLGTYMSNRKCAKKWQNELNWKEIKDGKKGTFTHSLTLYSHTITGFLIYPLEHKSRYNWASSLPGFTEELVGSQKRQKYA